MTLRLLLVPLLAVLAACAADRASRDVAPAADPAHSSRNALDWAGRYQGTLPCADCEGIETLLVLRGDLGYRLEQRHLGKPGGPVVHEGRFRWEADGNAIQLEDLPGAPGRYQVMEGRLIHLDAQGERITGALAEHYLLARVPDIDPALLGRRWRLVELRGEALAGAAGAPDLRFDDEGRVSGHAGCNRYFGSASVPRPGRVAFGGVGATKMACPDMRVEAAFLEALAGVDGYAVSGESLSLHRARMAPLLRFVAEPERNP